MFNEKVGLAYTVELLLLAISIFFTIDLYFEDLCFSLAISFSLDRFSFFNLSFFFGFIRGTWVSLFS